MVGSVDERIGGGGGSCSGDRDRTGGGNWDSGKGDWEGCTWSSTVTMRLLRLSPPVRPRGWGTTGRILIGDDIIDGDCERFFKASSLRPLLVHNNHHRHKSGAENTHPLLRAAPILPTFPPLEYSQGGDDDPDNGYCNPAITKSIGVALASPVQMRQRQRMSRGGVVAAGAGKSPWGDKSPLQSDLYLIHA